VNTAKKIISVIYRSEKKEGAYLYTCLDDKLTKVPEALLAQLGKLHNAMTLVLKPERKLAHANIDRVMADLLEQGYYLQLPPIEQRSEPTK
jgi:hypothetical protein